MIANYILIALFITPWIALICLTFIPRYRLRLLCNVAFIVSFLILLLSLLLLFFYNTAPNTYFSCVVSLPYQPFFLPQLKIGVDAISIWFIILTAFLFPICILLGLNTIKYRYKEFTIVLLMVEACLIGLFCVIDLVLFYIFFEAVLLPMFVLIGVWGSRQRKIHAAYQFFLYTLFGSLFMLFAILFIYNTYGTTDFVVLYLTTFSEDHVYLLWLAFFFAFAVKIPLAPFHIWLPEAHVEAPTAGSVILAGVLLKLGAYGMLRVLIPIFPTATIYFAPLVYTICILTIFYAALSTIRQIDLKKIIAYSSIVHMAYVVLGLFSYNIIGMAGAYILMVGHAFVSGGLFLAVGLLYDRYHTRIVFYYSSLFVYMPIFSFFFFFFTLGNISFPGTSNFVGEFLVLIGITAHNPVVGVFACFGIIFSAVYAIWLVNRIFFRSSYPTSITVYADVSRREFAALLPFAVAVLLLGLFPQILINDIEAALELSMQPYFELLVD